MSITVWRITSPRYAADAFTGEGALKVGQRWNNPGTAVVYTSESYSLATLERLVHFTGIGDFAGDVVLTATFDEALLLDLAPEDYPSDWQEFPAPASTKQIGDAWAASEASVALRVPSVIVPGQFNYLLNPVHPEWVKIAFGEPEPFYVDPRLLDKLSK